MTAAPGVDFTWAGWEVGRMLRIKPLAPLKHLFDPTAADKAATHPCVLIEKRADYGIVLTATSTIHEDLIDRVQNEYALPFHHVKNKDVAFKHLGTESRRDIDFSPSSTNSETSSDNGEPLEEEEKEEKEEMEEDEELDESVRKHLDWRPDSTTVAGFLQLSRMYVVRPHEVVKFQELGRNWRMDADSMATINERLHHGDVAELKRRCELVMDAAEKGESLIDVDDAFRDLFARLRLPMPLGHGYAGRKFATVKDLSIDLDATRMYHGTAANPVTLGGCASSSWRHNPQPSPSLSVGGKSAMLPPTGKGFNSFACIRAPWTPRGESTSRFPQRPGTSHGPETGSGKQDWRHPIFQSQTPVRAHFAQRHHQKRNLNFSNCPSNAIDFHADLKKGKANATFPARLATLQTRNIYSALPSPAKSMDKAEVENMSELKEMLDGLIKLSLSSEDVKKRMNLPAVVRNGFRCAEHRDGDGKGCDCHWRVRGTQPSPDALAKMRAVFVPRTVLVR